MSTECTIVLLHQEDGRQCHCSGGEQCLDKVQKPPDNSYFYKEYHPSSSSVSQVDTAGEPDVDYLDMSSLSTVDTASDSADTAEERGKTQAPPDAEMKVLEVSMSAIRSFRNSPPR